MADAKTWAKRVAAWRRGGLTAPDFAAKTGVSPRTLRYWAWRIEREGKPRLVRVVPAAAREPQGSTPLRIVSAPTETVIEIGAGEARVVVRIAPAERELFAQVLREVAGALFEAARAERRP